MKIYVLILLLGTIAAFAHMSEWPKRPAGSDRLG
jgi:hypothetical protein